MGFWLYVDVCVELWVWLDRVVVFDLNYVEVWDWLVLMEVYLEKLCGSIV